MKKRISLIIAIVMIAAVFATAIPFAAFAAESPDDIVAELWVEGESTAAYRVKRSEFAEKFKYVSEETPNLAVTEGNITAIEAAKGHNFTVKLLMDVDVETALCTIYTANGITVTFDGDADGDGVRAVLAGSNGERPSINADSILAIENDGGKVIFKNFDYMKLVNNLFQYFNWTNVEVENCFWMAADSAGYGICPADNGSITLKNGAVIEAGKYAFYGNWGVDGAKTNTITLEAGSSITSGTVVNIAAGKPEANMNIILNGGEINGKMAFRCATFTMNSGTVNGKVDVHINNKDATYASGGVAFFNGGTVNGDVASRGTGATFTVDGTVITGSILASDGGTITLTSGAVGGKLDLGASVVLTQDPAFLVGELPEVTTEEVTTTDGGDGETTTTGGGNDETTTTEKQDDETTPSATTTDGGDDKPSVTTPNATTPPPAADEGCAGCGGIAIAAQLVALICAAAVVIIKKK